MLFVFGPHCAFKSTVVNMLIDKTEWEHIDMTDYYYEKSELRDRSECLGNVLDADGKYIACTNYSTMHAFNIEEIERELEYLRNAGFNVIVEGPALLARYLNEGAPVLVLECSEEDIIFRRRAYNSKKLKEEGNEFNKIIDINEVKKYIYPFWKEQFGRIYAKYPNYAIINTGMDKKPARGMPPAYVDIGAIFENARMYFDFICEQDNARREGDAFKHAKILRRPEEGPTARMSAWLTIGKGSNELVPRAELKRDVNAGNNNCTATACGTDNSVKSPRAETEATTPGN